jgi:hypothetical protein
VFPLSPWIVALAGLGGVTFALVTRPFYPRRYELLGRVRERGEDGHHELQAVRPAAGDTASARPRDRALRVQLRSAAVRRPFSTRE